MAYTTAVPNEFGYVITMGSLAQLSMGGFDMICSGRDKIETPEQFKQAEETARKLDLDGLVVIGGDDSNTNACLLAENFRSKNLKTRVIGCPKTIDGDLKCKEVPTSFGFDTACKIYAEMIGNVMIDARSTGKYYHFVRLMGRAASHITLECALQTHPNITVIGEEVAAKNLTLKNVTDYIVDVICKRAEVNYNYGVILIPEGLIDFIPEVQQLIAELNEILVHDIVDDDGLWKKKLTDQSLKLFDFLPQAIQEQLMLERDPHGNVQVAKIETEKMLIQMVETELEKRKQEGKYKGEFKGQSHFFGYEGRCGLPTNFDAMYCYALGYGAGVLLHSGKTGLISSVANLSAPVEEWTVGGTALTALMDVERRHGKFKPVIKKAMVELEGAPFKKFASLRDEWALKNCYISPGPIQFSGPGSDAANHTLLLELVLNETHVNYADFNDEWIIDSGCSHHVTGDDSVFLELRQHDGERVIVTADNSTYPVMKEGVVKIGVDRDTDIKLNDVYHVPGLKKNLVSVSQITNSGKYVLFGPNDVKVLDNMKNVDANVVLSGKKKGSLFVMSAGEAYVKKTSQTDSAAIWHARKGWKCMDPETKKFITSREVVFYEVSSYAAQTSNVENAALDDNNQDDSLLIPEPNASRSDESVVSRMDSPNTGNVEQNTRRSSRERKQPDYLKDYEVQLNHCTVTSCFFAGESNEEEPTCYEDAKAFRHGGVKRVTYTYGVKSQDEE
ncbi:pyrophosphate--fructose 6-phosphate 1-phosphotransferase subunit beta [Senna tora]|uniref:Pyrophosphate--fructose 6-phosphate 1-phosphotransferase subunit beta n=1 Tax=Senna tora TaxID=362788 RepID=A0A835CHY1_9FABA|nr:pyrophosphate--fructose 6-phosphate 1-phosphotransferase subunit beta [Senna tora]